MDTIELVEIKTGNYTAYYGENLLAKLTWKNHAIEVGTPLFMGFLLGDGEHVFVFEHGGVYWLMGSIAADKAPGLSAEQTVHVPSKAAWIGSFDVLGWVGQAVGAIDIIAWEGRIIGIHADEFMANMHPLGIKWFHKILTVESPVGFTLDIINPPATATHWRGGFTYPTNPDHLFWEYDSGWIGLGTAWHVPVDPVGNYLRVRVANVPDQVMLIDKEHLGPVYDGKQYRFDCATEELYEIS